MNEKLEFQAVPNMEHVTVTPCPINPEVNDPLRMYDATYYARNPQDFATDFAGATANMVDGRELVPVHQVTETELRNFLVHDIRSEYGNWIGADKFT